MTDIRLPSPGEMIYLNELPFTTILLHTPDNRPIANPQNPQNVRYNLALVDTGASQSVVPTDLAASMTPTGMTRDVPTPTGILHNVPKVRGIWTFGAFPFTGTIPPTSTARPLRCIIPALSIPRPQGFSVLGIDQLTFTGVIGEFRPGRATPNPPGTAPGPGGLPVGPRPSGGGTTPGTTPGVQVTPGKGWLIIRPPEPETPDKKRGTTPRVPR